MLQCDNCSAVLSKNRPVPTYAVELKTYALPPNDRKTELSGIPPIQEGSHHFCDLNCLQSWILGLSD